MTTPDPVIEAEMRKVGEILAARSDCDHIDASDIDEIIAKAWPLLHDAYKADMRKVVPERTTEHYTAQGLSTQAALTRCDEFNKARRLILGEGE